MAKELAATEGKIYPNHLNFKDAYVSQLQTILTVNKIIFFNLIVVAIPTTINR